MAYYQDITLLPTADVSISFLWQKVYKQIHLALVDNKKPNNTSAIGLAFPEYDADQHKLGNKLRLFAEDEALLNRCQCEQWLNRLKDYVYISSIKPVPEKLIGHACFKQVKFNGSKGRMIRRRLKRTDETLEQVLEHFKDFKEQLSPLPYIQSHSETNGHRFRLFIDMSIQNEPKYGVYSCYGLSNEFTVPLF